MEYSEYMNRRILEKRHAFIYGEMKERSAYLQYLAKESFLEDGKMRIPIYTDFQGFKDTENKDCEKERLYSFQNSYFELYIISLMLDRLKAELKDEDRAKLESNLTQLFFEDSLISFDILSKELEIGMEAYKEFYDYYIKTGELKSNLFDQVKLDFVMLDLFLPDLKKIVPSLSDFILIVDKRADFSLIYTKVINTYVASRSNGYLNMKIGCENSEDWKNYSAINGELIEYVHDYNVFEMKDWQLTRTKKEQ